MYLTDGYEGHSEIVLVPTPSQDPNDPLVSLTLHQLREPVTDDIKELE
jgi:hypothetical protein